MGLFKKKRETIDFTQFPGMRVKSPDKSFRVKGDFVDLTDRCPKKKFEVKNTDDKQVSSKDSFIDFLSGNSESKISEDSSHLGLENPELPELKNKMKHLTNQLESNSNEVYRLIQRIELLEKKIERIENRGI